ncbi:MAG: hypothetical protein ACREQL_14840 [Candidatus Binatia bacterium]
MAVGPDAEAHRLEAEIANEPQWVVFDDAEGEDAWAARELAATAIVAAWWAGTHA